MTNAIAGERGYYKRNYHPGKRKERSRNEIKMEMEEFGERKFYLGDKRDREKKHEAGARQITTRRMKRKELSV